MIGRLRGEIVESEGTRVLIEVAGVGYELLVPESVGVGLLPGSEEVILHVRQVVREDGITLYGFSESFQRRMFDLLVEVKGCGPKTALAIISDLGEDGAASAIATQDTKMLARATGVGPRLAERIVLELKDKIQNEMLMRKLPGRPSRAVVSMGASDDLVDALLALGYRRQEAEIAANDARAESDVVEEQLKAALRSLKK